MTSLPQPLRRLNEFHKRPYFILCGQLQFDHQRFPGRYVGDLNHRDASVPTIERLCAPERMFRGENIVISGRYLIDSFGQSIEIVSHQL
jgi:hypothetical protein